MRCRRREPLCRSDAALSENQVIECMQIRNVRSLHPCARPPSKLVCVNVTCPFKCRGPCRSPGPARMQDSCIALSRYGARSKRYRRCTRRVRRSGWFDLNRSVAAARPRPTLVRSGIRRRSVATAPAEPKDTAPGHRRPAPLHARPSTPNARIERAISPGSSPRVMKTRRERLSSSGQAGRWVGTWTRR